MKRKESRLAGRAQRAVHRVLHPVNAAILRALVNDPADRDPQGVKPTSRQYAESVAATNALVALANRSRRERGKLREALLRAKNAADAADMAYVELAEDRAFIDARQAAERFRAHFPEHALRMTFRNERQKAAFKAVVSVACVLVDFGLWFRLCQIGLGISWTKPASTTDPTPVFDPGFFLRHPMEWVTAAVVPLIASATVLIATRAAARVWAQRSALAAHPELAVLLSTEISVKRVTMRLVAVGVLSIINFVIAAQLFSENADSLGVLVALVWLILPWTVTLAERYASDAAAEARDKTLGAAADGESKRKALADDLMTAEDTWRGSWEDLDQFIRELLDEAGSIILVFESLVAEADSRANKDPKFAQMAQAPADADVTTRRHAVLTQTRGLSLRLPPWIVQQIEQDLQLLAVTKPLDLPEERTARLHNRFEEVYAKATADVAEHAATQASLTDAIADAPVEESPTADSPIGSPRVAVAKTPSEDDLDDLMALPAATR